MNGERPPTGADGARRPVGLVYRIGLQGLAFYVSAIPVVVVQW